MQGYFPRKIKKKDKLCKSYCGTIFGFVYEMYDLGRGNCPQCPLFRSALGQRVQTIPVIKEAQKCTKATFS